MKTIWFCGEDEKILTIVAEIVGEGLINRDQNAEIIVHSEVQEILGKGLKNIQEDKSIFTDRLGFLGSLLHRNNIFALIVSKEAIVEDRKKVKEDYGNYLQVNLGNKDSLCDLTLDIKDDIKANAKKTIDFLIKEKIVSEQYQTVYSEDEEKEIRKRLEDLGYV